MPYIGNDPVPLIYGLLNAVSETIDATSTTVVDGDRLVLRDASAAATTKMRQIIVEDLSAYLDDKITAMPNLVSVGALNVGSITSGFTSIDVGAGAITTTGIITGGTLEATTDTASGDNAAIGYTSAEGLILTGQGSTNDVTIKNDADADVLKIPTGTTNVDVVGNLGVGGNLTVTGTTAFNGGTITLGDAAADNVVFGADVNSSIIPNGAGGSFDLGSSGQEWRDLFINGTAHIDTLDVDENATVTGTLGVTGIATFTDDIIIGDGKTIGSASDVDAITIAANGQLTLTQTLIGTALDISGDIDVDGTTNLDIVDIDGAVNIAADVTIASTNKIIFNDASQFIQGASNAILDINATDEIELNATLVDMNANLDVSGTITSGGIITGTAFTAGSAVLAEAELELLDGLTAGTAIASKVVTTDANIDTSGQRNLTITGELDAATLDISGAIDVAGNSVLASVDVTGVATAATFEPDGDTAAGDNAAIGYTSAEGLILTGQGSTNDITIKNDADADVITIATGTTVVGIPGSLDIEGAIDVNGTANLDVVDIDGAVDMASTLAVAGVLTAASLDISGDIDVDGTANLDVVDIDGAVNMATTALVTGVLTTTATQVATGGITSGAGIVSDTDGTDDLGTTSVRWRQVYADAVTVTDEVIATGFTGTLDGILGSGTAAAATTTTLAATTGTFSGILKTDDTTAATSTTDGSLQTDGGLSVKLDAVIGDDLIMISDASVIHFGADADVNLTHVHNAGLTLNVPATADNSFPTFTLAAGDNNIAANDVLGAISFIAPAEGAGTDAVAVAASIQAISEGDFSASNNATKMSFMLGASEAATEKASLSSAGVFATASLDISGNVDVDGTLEADAITVNGTALAEFIADTAGAMFSSNTETGIAATYQDGDNTIDLVIGAGAIVHSMLGADLIDGDNIGDDVINSEHYVAASIDNEHLADNAVNTAEIANDAVTYAKMQNLGTADRVLGSTSTGVIGEVQIVADMIASGAVVAAKIGADAVTAAKIGDNVINSEHYAAASIDNEHLADNAVNTAEIANDAVTYAKMQDLGTADRVLGSTSTGVIGEVQIVADMIASGAVVAAKIGADAITAAKIGDDVINSEHYAHGSIDTVHIAADQITAALIADNVLNSEHYAAGSIDAEHLASNSVTTAKINADAVTAAKIGNDVINSEHYAAGSIDREHLAADIIDGSKIADDVINSEHYAAGSIDNEHIADDAINSEHYAAGSIDTAHIADAQVTGAKIAADTVAEANMANDAISSVELKSLATLLILDEDGSTVRTFHCAGA